MLKESCSVRVHGKQVSRFGGKRCWAITRLKSAGYLIYTDSYSIVTGALDGK
ncbi:hypothetical protein DPMN_132804 [Dreissena polymorpha]|uniref:Uncharacterized protein n=1 Tax=Dreissena polymorpha TaxID=45954 RepID=A0A9D4JE65_DREPO|nr:hypothetical protein DPMN_132804 [Dreissena polymorpha]